MKTYADLNLKKIRDDCGLDFARHTYGRGQCSCCYGPQDMGKKWWVKGEKPKKIVAKRDETGKPLSYVWDRKMNEFTYILFDNAENGSGRIKSLKEPIKNHTYVSYKVKSQEQLEKICEMLQEQLGTRYLVEVPQEGHTCICIFYGNIYTVDEMLTKIKNRDYHLRKGKWYYFDDIKGRMDHVIFDASIRKTKYNYVIQFI